MPQTSPRHALPRIAWDSLRAFMAQSGKFEV